MTRRWLATLAEDRRRPDLGRPVQASAPRLGVMLHYDASASDEGSLAWLLDPRNTLGYNVLVWDNGRAFEIIDLSLRAPHAGRTKSSDIVRLPYPDHQANSAFYGVAIAATAGDTVRLPQLGTTLAIVARIFEKEGWPLSEASWRLTSHHLEAWPRGRKVDVQGPDPANPVLDIHMVRHWLASAGAVTSPPLQGGPS